MSLSKYRSKVDRITQSVRNLAVRHNFYFQIIGSFLILSLVSYLHFMQPPSLDVISFTLLDKLAHFLMFFFTMMWFMYITRKWLVAAVSLLLLALVLEWIQMNYIINRSFDWFDWIADGIGIVLCLLLLPVLIDKYFDNSV
ncbi:MAG TPA: hypothetical protein EYM72_04410 [Gammaproteobacteria bacterium]|nr:hypothetical protein [Gammaproteobacteria bacterium]